MKEAMREANVYLIVTTLPDGSKPHFLLEVNDQMAPCDHLWTDRLEEATVYTKTCAEIKLRSVPAPGRGVPKILEARLTM
jgi:hypothetical protein